MSDNPRFILSTVESDSHTWNLIYLEMLLEEQHVEVINLGPCVPAQVTIEAMSSLQPDAVVISSVNGHGGVQGKSLLQLARQTFSGTQIPMLIGGKLSTRDSNDATLRRELLQAGFDAVFTGAQAVPEFRNWLTAFKQQHACRLESTTALDFCMAAGERDSCN